MKTPLSPDKQLSSKITVTPESVPALTPISTANKKSKLTIHELTSIAMMTAVITLMAHIAIPVGPVPFTLQTAGLIGITLLLPRRSALICLLVYVLLGACGLPVFSGGRGGLAILAGPSGGFIFGFFPGAWLGIQALGRREKSGLIRAYLAATLALICSFTWGTLYYAYVMGVSLQQAFTLAALPFIGIDIGKIAVFTPLFWRIRHSLHRQFPHLF